MHPLNECAYVAEFGLLALTAVGGAGQLPGSVPVANAEELLAMKVLSMTDTRLQDRIEAKLAVVLHDVGYLKR
ncbi:MAG: hypothetical protein WDO74_28975 [Pseudomonadota bacterium]